MKQSEYQKYLQSAHWQKRRKEAIEDAGHICERCHVPRWLARIAYSQDLNVHHLSYANLGHEEAGDLEILCLHCHDIETHGRSDLHAPKTATCTVCGDKHWNIYSDLCGVCTTLLSEDVPLGLRFGHRDPRDGKELWKSVLGEIVWYVDSKPLHEIFAVVTDTIKKIIDSRRSMDDESEIPF